MASADEEELRSTHRVSRCRLKVAILDSTAVKVREVRRADRMTLRMSTTGPVTGAAGKWAGAFLTGGCSLPYLALRWRSTTIMAALRARPEADWRRIRLANIGRPPLPPAANHRRDHPPGAVSRPDPPDRHHRARPRRPGAARDQPDAGAARRPRRPLCAVHGHREPDRRDHRAMARRPGPETGIRNVKPIICHTSPKCGNSG